MVGFGVCYFQRKTKSKFRSSKSPAWLNQLAELQVSKFWLLQQKLPVHYHLQELCQVKGLSEVRR